MVHRRLTPQQARFFLILTFIFVLGFSNSLSVVAQQTTPPAEPPTDTPVPSDTPEPTATDTSIPTDTPLPTATDTPVPSDTPLPTSTDTAIPTDTPLPSSTDTPVPSDTALPTATDTAVPSDTALPNITETSTDVSIPSESGTNTPTLTPTETGTATATVETTSEATQEPSSTSTDELESSSTPIMPTGTPDIPPESDVELLFSDTFDNGLAAWTLGEGWLTIPNEDGQALQVFNSNTPSTLSVPELMMVENVAVQAQFLMNAGSAQLNVQQSGAGGYTAILEPQGTVTLYRASNPVAATTITAFDTNQWHTLRLSTIGDYIRVAVDGSEVIALLDPGSFPPGTISLNAVFAELSSEATPPVNTLIIEDFSVWQAASQTSVPTDTPLPTATATLTPTATPTITPTAPIPTATPTNAPAEAVIEAEPFEPAMMQSLSSGGDISLGFDIAPGDVDGLIEAINIANRLNAADTYIALYPKSTYTLTQPFAGSTRGLPEISAHIFIDGNNAIIERDSSAPLFGLIDISGDLILYNAILQGGELPSSDSFEAAGGAILVRESGQLQAHYTLIRNNIAQYGGGIALFSSRGSNNFNSLRITDNTAYSSGGGLYVNGGTLGFWYGDISSNHALGNESGMGGGGLWSNASLWNGGPIFIDNNDTDGTGGGLYLDTSSGLITASEISNNHAPTSAASGVYTAGSNIDLDENCISGNTNISIFAVTTLNARNVWWGHELGPSTAENPNRGDSINGLVVYDPISSTYVTSCALSHDSDGDLIWDFWENSDWGRGTDPLKADTDDDGIPDNMDLNPNIPDNTLDGDEDGWTDDVDNCIDISNPDQANTDGGVWGDACDYDDDNDGLSDEDEISYGSNPLAKDTDGDGISDLEDDLDGDGLSTEQELIGGTNPGNPDTDGDLLNDGAELNLFLTDPLNADSDDDGIPDGEEDADEDGLPNSLELNILHTNPLAQDSDNNSIPDGLEDFDGDGLPNALEVRLGTNPAEHDSDGNGTDDGNEDPDGDGLTNLQEIARGTDPANADSDSDTVGDAVDNCPTLPNADQADTDGDGDGNACEPGPADFFQSELSIDPESAAANGQDPIFLTVVVRDSVGRVMNNTPVTLSPSGLSDLSVTPLSGMTDDNGRFIAQMTSTAIGAATIGINADGVSLGDALVTFRGPDPEVHIDALPEIMAGQYLLYAVEVSNPVDSSVNLSDPAIAAAYVANDISVLAALPLGAATYVTESHPSDSELMLQASNQVVWKLPTLLPNETRIFRVIARASGNLTFNTNLVFNAQISAPVDNSRLNNATQVMTVVHAPTAPSGVVINPDEDRLSVSLTAVPTAASFGQPITLHVNVTNTGMTPLYNVLGYTPLNLAGVPQRLVLAWPNALYPGRLLPNESATATFTYALSDTFPSFETDSQSVPINWVIVRAHDATFNHDDPSFLVVQGDDLTTSGASPELDYQGPGIRATVSGQYNAVASQIEYTVTIFNAMARTDSLTNLTIQDTLPNTLAETPTPITGTVEHGGSLQYAFVYPIQPNDPPVISNVITIHGTGVDFPNVAVETQVVSTVRITNPAQTGANLIVDASGFRDPIVAEADINLPIWVRNAASAALPAENVSVSLTLPTNVEFVDAGPTPGTYNPATRTIIWTRSEPLEVGTGFVVSPIVRVHAPVGTTITVVVNTWTSTPETSFTDNGGNPNDVTMTVAENAATNSQLIPVDEARTTAFVVADGQDVLQLRLVARDRLDVLVPNAAVTFSADAPGLTFALPGELAENATATLDVTTDDNGEAVVALRATETGFITVYATFADGTQTSLMIERRPSPVELDTDQVTIGAGSTATIQVTVLNTYSAGDRIQLQVSGLEALNITPTITPDVLPLASGQFGDAELTLQIPSDTCTFGSNTLTITAVSETRTDDNQAPIVYGSASADVVIAQSAPPLTNLLPANNATLSNALVTFSWRSPVAGTSKVYVRPAGTTTYSEYTLTANLLDPTMYSAIVPLNQPGVIGYEWYGKHTSLCGGETLTGSAEVPYTVTIVPSVAFTARTYAFTVGDDYDQTTDVNGNPLRVRIHNDENIARTIAVDVVNPYPDLILGFTGSGSVGRPVTVQPGQTLNLTLRVFTQEATRDTYALALTLYDSTHTISDNVPLTITVHQPQPDIQFIDPQQDPRTLVTTVELRNYGDPVTDFNLDILDSETGIPADFTVEPDIHHVYLPTYSPDNPFSSITISIIPNTIENADGTTPVSNQSPSSDSVQLMSLGQSNLSFEPPNQTPQPSGAPVVRYCYKDTCEDAGGEILVSNKCAPTMRVSACNGAGTYTSTTHGLYCTNNPSISVRQKVNGADFPASSVDRIWLTMAFAPGNVSDPYYHTADVSANGYLLGSYVVPQTSSIRVEVPPEVLVSGDQMIQLDSHHPEGAGAHLTWTTNIGFEVEVSDFTRYQCVPEGEEVFISAEMPMCISYVGYQAAQEVTPLPTPTVTPTATPVPIFYYVTCSGPMSPDKFLNIRMQPNSRATVIEQISAGSQIQRVDETTTFEDEQFTFVPIYYRATSQVYYVALRDNEGYYLSQYRDPACPPLSPTPVPSSTPLPTPTLDPSMPRYSPGRFDDYGVGIQSSFDIQPPAVMGIYGVHDGGTLDVVPRDSEYCIDTSSSSDWDNCDPQDSPVGFEVYAPVDGCAYRFRDNPDTPELEPSTIIIIVGCDRNVREWLPNDPDQSLFSAYREVLLIHIDPSTSTVPESTYSNAIYHEVSSGEFVGNLCLESNKATCDIDLQTPVHLAVKIRFNRGGGNYVPPSDSEVLGFNATPLCLFDEWAANYGSPTQNLDSLHGCPEIQ